jgi:hypothetical protein
MTTTEGKDRSGPVEPPRVTKVLQKPDAAHGPRSPADVAAPPTGAIGLLVDLADVLRGELGREDDAIGHPPDEERAGSRLPGDLEPVAPAAVIAAADLDRDT